VREALSDRFGALDVTPLLWQGDLPGLGGNAALFARDLGPERNAALIAAESGRRAFLLTADTVGRVNLEPYDIGVLRLWGAAAEVAQ
jgi:hypothetical protein